MQASGLHEKLMQLRNGGRGVARHLTVPLRDESVDFTVVTT